MENELTLQVHMPYSYGRYMDDNAPEVNAGQNQETTEKTVEDDKKIEVRIRQNLTEKQKKAKEAWEEENKKKEERGEKVSEEEKEAQKKLAEKGQGPISGGSGDGYFENFPVEKFEGRLRDLAEEIKNLGSRSEITPERLQEMQTEARNLRVLGRVSDVAEDDFNSEINRVIVAQQRSEPYGQQRESSQQARQHPSQEPSNATLGENEVNAAWITFNAFNYQGTPLEELANSIISTGRSSVRVTSQHVNSWDQRARQLLESGSAEDRALYSRFREDLIGTAREHESRAASERLENTPSSIQEMCKWIAQKEGKQWDVGGVNALLEKSTLPDGREIYEFKSENFVKWVRERMLFFHNFSPDDPNVNLLGQIGVETEFRTIGLGTMITNKNRYFRDEITGEVYDQFIEDLVNEVFLFNQSRNYDAGYRFEMWSDEGLPKFLAGIHQKSVFTNASQLKAIMTLSADVGRKDENGNEIKDTKVGDSIRKIYEAYYYFSDYEKLKEVLGEKGSSFFTRAGFENAVRIIGDLDTSVPIPEEYKELLDGIFDANGNAKPAEFINFINLFNDQGKKQSTIALVREALRLSVSNIYGLENGLNEAGEKRKIPRKNLEYAEAFAWSMTRWTGAAARNDTSAIGFDAFTKFQKFQDYRVRQARAERGGAFGNEYDLPVVKGLALDFFNGIFVEKEIGENAKDLTPFEIFQRLDVLDNRTDIDEGERERLKNIEFDRLKFKQYTQLDYSSNHLARASQVFQWLMDSNELNLDQIVKHEPFRGLVFDRAKFEKQVKEDFIKPIRYAFQTYSNIDYSKDMRVVDKKATQAAGRPIYKTVTFAEAMFGPDVLEDFYTNKRDENGNRIIDKQKLVENRPLIYKRVVRALLASHLRAHRERYSGYTKMDYAQIEKFYEALESIRQIEIEDADENPELHAKQGFFTEQDIKWLRKKSKTGKGRMVMEDLAPDVAMGFLGGMGKSFKNFFEDIFK